MIREPDRKAVLRLILVLFLTIILENVLRKWVFPQYERALFFLHIPVVFSIYWSVLQRGIRLNGNPFFLIGLFFAYVTLLLIPIQFVLGNFGHRYLLIAGYGWHNYFFFLPLAFVIEKIFEPEDIARIARYTLILGIVSAPIVCLQFYSPVDAVLVSGTSDDPIHRFRPLSLMPGKVRPPGLFTSLLGQVVFVASLLSFIFVSWLDKGFLRGTSRYLIGSSTVAALLMILFSGQRALIVYVAVVIGGFLLISHMQKKKWRFSRTLAVVAAVGVVIVLFPTVFPLAYEGLARRFEAPAEQMVFGKFSLFKRIAYQLVKFTFFIDETPPMGYLIGLGGNAVQRMPWVSLPAVGERWSGFGGWIEDGLSRHIIELGVPLGLLFIVFRYAFFGWIGWKSYRAYQSGGSSFPMVFCIFLAPLMLFYHMTGNGILIFYTWFFIGLTLAGIRHARRKTSTPPGPGG